MRPAIELNEQCSVLSLLHNSSEAPVVLCINDIKVNSSFDQRKELKLFSKKKALFKRECLEFLNIGLLFGVRV